MERGEGSEREGSTCLSSAAKGEKGFRHRFKKRLGFTVKGAPSASVGTDGPTGASATAEVGGKELNSCMYHPFSTSHCFIPPPSSPPYTHILTQSVPRVDEEGYSIRPEDAATISQFPDDPNEGGGHSDSDSDSEDGGWID